MSSGKWRPSCLGLNVLTHWSREDAASGGDFADDIFRCIFLNENFSISKKIPLQYVPYGLIDNMAASVQIMAWCRTGTEAMMVSVLTHICITRPQCVNVNGHGYCHLIILSGTWEGLKCHLPGFLKPTLAYVAMNILRLLDVLGCDIIDLFWRNADTNTNWSETLRHNISLHYHFCIPYMIQDVPALLSPILLHDDIMKWKHFLRYWPFVLGIHRSLVNSPIHRSPVNSHHKGQWRGALMCSLICPWINDWASNEETGDLRHHPTDYDITVMFWTEKRGPRNYLHVFVWPFVQRPILI